MFRRLSLPGNRISLIIFSWGFRGFYYANIYRQRNISQFLLYQLCYHLLVRELRILFLIFFAFISARMLNEISTCHENIFSFCGEGLTVVITFLLSGYFFDSVFVDLTSSGSEENRKRTVLSLLLILPYLFYLMYVILEFFSSISIVTVEYIFSLDLILAFIFYGFVYWVNGKETTRKINLVFMATFILSLFFLRFVW